MHSQNQHRKEIAAQVTYTDEFTKMEPLLKKFWQLGGPEQILKQFYSCHSLDAKVETAREVLKKLDPLNTDTSLTYEIQLLVEGIAEELKSESHFCIVDFVNRLKAHSNKPTNYVVTKFENSPARPAPHYVNLSSALVSSASQGENERPSHFGLFGYPRSHDAILAPQDPELEEKKNEKLPSLIPSAQPILLVSASYTPSKVLEDEWKSNINNPIKQVDMIERCYNEGDLEAFDWLINHPGFNLSTLSVLEMRREKNRLTAILVDLTNEAKSANPENSAAYLLEAEMLGLAMHANRKGWVETFTWGKWMVDRLTTKRARPLANLFVKTYEEEVNSITEKLLKTPPLDKDKFEEQRKSVTLIHVNQALNALTKHIFILEINSDDKVKLYTDAICRLIKENSRGNRFDDMSTLECHVQTVLCKAHKMAKKINEGINPEKEYEDYLNIFLPAWFGVMINTKNLKVLDILLNGIQIFDDAPQGTNSTLIVGRYKELKNIVDNHLRNINGTEDSFKEKLKQTSNLLAQCIKNKGCWWWDVRPDGKSTQLALQTAQNIDLVYFKMDKAIRLRYRVKRPGQP